MFEYDPAKDVVNVVKHGISFDAAQALWLDDDAIILSTYGMDEERWLLVGRIEGKHWTAVFTIREGVTRIMSVRRARVNEVNQYGKGKDYGSGV